MRVCVRVCGEEWYLLGVVFVETSVRNLVW